MTTILVDAAVPNDLLALANELDDADQAYAALKLRRIVRRMPATVEVAA